MTKKLDKLEFKPRNTSIQNDIDDNTNKNKSLQTINDDNFDLISSTTDISTTANGDDECLRNYIKKINSFPVLTPSQESDLCDKFYNHGDKQAGNQIFLSHLRLVVKIAFGFKKYLDKMQELVSEGNVGLLKALKKFDMNKNVKFATYAMLWIKASIQEYIFKNKSVVPIATNAKQKNIIYNYAKINDESNSNHYTPIASVEKQKQMRQISQNGFDITIQSQEASENAFGNISESEAQNIYKRSKYNDIAIDESTFDSAYSHNASPLTDTIETPQEAYKNKSNQYSNSTAVLNAMDTLDERAKTIIKHRFLEEKKLTLTELSKILGISIERVRQIETTSIEKMRKALTTN